MTSVTLTRSIPLYSEGEPMEVEVTGEGVELRWMDDNRQCYLIMPQASFREILDTVAAFNALKFKEAPHA